MKIYTYTNQLVANKIYDKTTVCPGEIVFDEQRCFLYLTSYKSNSNHYSGTHAALYITNSNLKIYVDRYYVGINYAN